jgi:hypothetical protein
VRVNFVDELVQVVLVAGAQVDEGLHGLIGVGGKVLPLGGFDDFYDVVDKVGEIDDAVVHVGGFVDADEGFVEDLEEVAEEFERGWLKLLDMGPIAKRGWFVPLQSFAASSPCRVAACIA